VKNDSTFITDEELGHSTTLLAFKLFWEKALASVSGLEQNCDLKILKNQIFFDFSHIFYL